MSPIQFNKCLVDETRLKCILLLDAFKEACVCDLMQALDIEQPKISRHLAELRKCGVLKDERRGKWIFYKLHPTLPDWAKQVIAIINTHNHSYTKTLFERFRKTQKANQSCC